MIKKMENPIPPKQPNHHIPTWIISAIVIIFIIGVVIYYLLTQKTTTSSITLPVVQPVVTSITPTGFPSVAQQQNQITLTTAGFSPATVTIKVGDTVTWINQSGTDATVNSNPHPVHTAYPPLNLGIFKTGQSLSLSFPKAGTYGYHNHLNPGQTGTIIVQ